MTIFICGSPFFESFLATYIASTNGIVNTNTGMFGQLSATKNTTLKFTFLGKDAANTNSLILNGIIVAGSGTDIVTTNDSFLSNVSAGVVDFGFTGTGGLTASNTTKPQQNIASLTPANPAVSANGNTSIASIATIRSMKN